MSNNTNAIGMRLYAFSRLLVFQWVADFFISCSGTGQMVTTAIRGPLEHARVWGPYFVEDKSDPHRCYPRLIFRVYRVLTILADLVRRASARLLCACIQTCVWLNGWLYSHLISTSQSIQVYYAYTYDYTYFWLEVYFDHILHQQLKLTSWIFEFLEYQTIFKRRPFWKSNECFQPA